MKRVTTSLDAEGNPIVMIDELDDAAVHVLAEYRPGEIPAWLALMDPARAHTAIEPPERDAGADVVPGMEGDGFHETRTVDFNVLLSGELTMTVGGQDILLQAGDTVLQQGPRHRWRNLGTTTAVMVSLSHRPG